MAKSSLQVIDDGMSDVYVQGTWSNCEELTRSRGSREDLAILLETGKDSDLLHRATRISALEAPNHVSGCFIRFIKFNDHLIELAKQLSGP